MPRVQLLAAPTAEAEPVTLALANAALRLDLDVESTDPAIAGQLDYLQTLLSAAREKVEAYTGRFFAAQTLQLTYTLDEAYVLPNGAEATAVTGFFTEVGELDGWLGRMEEYRKGISISRELPWSEALNQAYTVTATIATPVVPALAKAAILELAGEWYRNRETTAAGVAVISELPVSWKVKLAQLVVNPLGC
jgi:hypothetical protein